MASNLRRVLAACAIVVALIGGYQYYHWAGRLIQVGDRRIDPAARIDPEREYHLVVWEHEVPLPWDHGAHRQALADAIEEFRSVWPNVTVDLQVIPWHGDHARLRESLAQGDPPDIYGMPVGARMIDASLQVPVDAYLSPEAKDDLLPSAASSLSDESGLWAWPKWVQPKLWVVREDLTPSLERGRSRWTKEELFSTLMEAKERSGGGLVLNPFDPNAFFEIMVASTGKNLIGPGGNREWSADEIAQGLSLFEELIEKGLTERDASAMARHRLSRFWNRRAAMIGPVNPWLLRHLMTRGGVVEDGRDEASEPSSHFSLAVPPPSFSEAESRARLPAVIAGYVVFRQQEYQGDDHTRAAMALAEHLSRRLGPWEAAHLFAVPAHPSAWNAWRDDAGLPAKELDLLVQWARLSLGPPLHDAFAHIQERAIETILASHFPKLWEGHDPQDLAEQIAAGVDGLRAVVKLQ